MKTVFLRALEDDDKSGALLAAVRGSKGGRVWRRFEVDAERFVLVPRSPFAYWVSDRILGLFQELEPFESSRRASRHGAATLSNFRFLRLNWEVKPVLARPKWRPYAKGGAYSPFFDDVHLAVQWGDDGEELKQYVSDIRESNGWGPHWTAVLNGYEFYLRPGITWPSRTQSGFAPRVLPSGCLFDAKGNAAFFGDDSASEILGFLAVFLSTSFRALVRMQMSFGSYDVGVVQRTPVPGLTRADEAILSTIARRAWSFKRRLDTRTETSHAFVLPALLQVESVSLAARFAAWSEHVQEIEAKLGAIQAEIDERCFELYGIDEEDRRVITEGFGGSAGGSEASDDDAEVDAEDEAEAVVAADATTLVAELISWTVGIAIGRFDVRLATGDRSMPVEPEPFDPLPVCSPARLTGDDGLPLARPPAGYPLSFPEDGVLVDDPGHPRDLSAAVRAVFETVFGARTDAVWQEAAALLDPRGHELRSWLASGFFEHHLKRHSKSRRKAPILWQLGVPSGRYSVWCCAHRLTRDSLFAIGNDIVAPKLAHEERRHSGLVTGAGPTPSARDRAEIATQEAVVDELRTLLDEVRRVAPLWNPDLDDGIVLVMAPLWRLVPGHRAWQKELKSRWDDLVAGKYDWAHLAMHLWPERVVPKCAADRSLAIAHGLEEVFWIEGADGKWTRRATPARPIDDLVAERSSPAVKAALSDLLEAPGPTRGGGRRRANAGVTV
jgi:hypothetical protein